MMTSTTERNWRLIFFALLPLSLLVETSEAAEAESRPNVVIIYADDLGYGDLGCYGHPKFKTPRIDKMAAEGARLTSFSSCCPYCAPSRAGLLTGRYQFRSGMTRNPAPDAGLNDPGIPDSELTLAEMFRTDGYRTICIGKWHLGHKPEFRPLRHGFHEYLGILYSNDMRPVELIEGSKPIDYPVIQANLTRRYTERALKFIEQNQARPFFLYLPHAMPHKPLAASEKFYKQSGAGLYGDVIAELDWSVGAILDKLKELHLDERTLVIFASDNGPWYGGSTGGLRGMKGNGWEGGIRVPLIARLPGVIPAGHVNDAPAIIMDVFTTTLTAAGITIPDDRVIDGKDIMPLLKTDAPSPHEVLFSMRKETIITVRGGRWKLHVHGTDRARYRSDDWVDPRAPDGVTLIAPFEQSRPREYPGSKTGDTSTKPALFDLDNDPGEQHNVADQHPEIVARLMRRYDDIESQSQAARKK